LTSYAPDAIFSPLDRKATTFRIDPVVRDGLFKLSALLGRPANQLANDALREYVDRRIGEVEDDLESTLADLRAYRKSDPNFDRAIAEFVEAEVNLKDDPAEGKLVEPVGPTEAKVLALLDE
jgi:predicted transcriptional regulator